MNVVTLFLNMRLTLTGQPSSSEVVLYDKSK